MLYFAKPLSDNKTRDNIKKLLKENVVKYKRGIKACTKAIISNLVLQETSKTKNDTTHGYKGILILAADISPPDMVSFFPALAFEANILILFVPKMKDLKYSNSYKKPASCILIEFESDDNKLLNEICEFSKNKQVLF